MEIIVGMLVMAVVWMALDIRNEKQKRRILTQRVNTMQATVATVSASLTTAQNTLAAIVAANPTAPDLSGLQTQADALASASGALATSLGVTVPSPAPVTPAPAPTDPTQTPSQ